LADARSERATGVNARSWPGSSLASAGDGPLPLHTSYYPTAASKKNEVPELPPDNRRGSRDRIVGRLNLRLDQSSKYLWLITSFLLGLCALSRNRKVALRLFLNGPDHGRMAVSLYHAEYEALRNLMRSLRVTAGLTQAQMAEALGVGQSYVSKLERGENFVDVLLFARWCSVCGVKPDIGSEGEQAVEGRSRETE
jgi:hypothetical protein